MKRLALWASSISLMSIGTVGIVDLPTQRLPAYGGSGGLAFTRDCGSGRVLTGLQGRDGMLVDAVGLMCRPVNGSGVLGPESIVGTLVGGGGGATKIVRCPSGQVVTGVRIRYATYVDMIALQCRLWDASTRTSSGTLAIANMLGTSSASGSYVVSTCATKQQPARGIHGRAQAFVDAIGLTCDEP